MRLLRNTWAMFNAFASKDAAGKTPTEWREITNQRLAAICGLVALIVIGSIGWWHGQAWPIMGWLSVATVLAVSCGAAGMIGFYSGFRLNHELRQRIGRPWKRQLYSISLAVAYAIFYGVLGILVALFVDNAFKGIVLDEFTMTALGAAGAVISSYSSWQWASTLTSIGVSQTMVGFLIIGVCSSMILNNDPEWWRQNFSYLGSIDSNTFILFSFTLIISGLLLLAITDYIGYDVQQIGRHNHLFAKRAHWLRQGIVGIGLCMILLGAFPNVHGELLWLLHNIAAKVLVGIFIALIIFVSWLLPGVNRTFYYISYAFGLSIAVMYIALHHWLGYLSITGFELLSFFICIAWLYLLLQIIAAQAKDASS